MGVVAKMVNRFLNDQLNSEASSAKLRDIWRGSEDTWQNLMTDVDVKIVAAKSLHNATSVIPLPERSVRTA
jgi:hypothetical protein